MSKRVVAISDLHCGHFVGLTPPIWWSNQDRFPELGSIQRAMWTWYETTIAAMQPIDALLVLGDCIDGKGSRSGGTELIVTDLSEQCEMASYAIKSVGSPVTIMVYGTPYHASPYGEDYEKSIADDVGACISGHKWAAGNGVIFDLKHKVGGSAIPHGRYTAIAREKLWGVLWDAHGQGYDSDIILRGHVHYYAEVGGFRRKGGKMRRWIGRTMPALQGPGSKYGVKECSGTVDVGLLEINIEDNGDYRCIPHMMDMTIAKPEMVQLW